MQSASGTRSSVTVILLAWAVLFAASYVVPPFIAPTGEGFFRGFNRVAYWFWLQVVAFVLAAAASVLAHARRADISRSLKRSTLLPLLIAAAEAIFLASIIY